MAIGPGKYGARAAQIMLEVDGTMCVVILYGPKGPGFDVCTSDPALLSLLPFTLREIADSIEKDLTAKAPES